MKTVYFIRHGESETNAGTIRVGEKAGLTEKGKEQAEFIAGRCEKLTLDTVISSTLERARQTTEIVNKKIQKPVEFSDLFVERRRPSEQNGVAKDSPETVKAERAIWKNFCVPGWKYSDEENFEDLKDRAKKALALLEDRTEENILVITHGFFMRVVVAYATMGEDLTAEQCEQFINKFHTENTGLTVLKYDIKSRRTPWFLWIWNDHAHLAE